MHPEDFFDQAVAAVLEAGGRALVATGPARTTLPSYDEDRVHVVPFVPFSRVAPRCRAAIHHGGIGTAVAIVRAGIPQVVVPKGFDQPDTAVRLEELGVGVALPWRSRHRRLRGAVASALHDERLRANAARLGDLVRQEDGAVTTADAVERMLH